MQWANTYTKREILSLFTLKWKDDTLSLLFHTKKVQWSWKGVNVTELLNRRKYENLKKTGYHHEEISRILLKSHKTNKIKQKSYMNPTNTIIPWFCPLLSPPPKVSITKKVILVQEKHGDKYLSWSRQYCWKWPQESSAWVWYHTATWPWSMQTRGKNH